MQTEPAFQKTPRSTAKRALLQNRSFTALWLGETISELGGAFGSVCNPLLVYQLTGSKVAMGSLALMYFIPSLIMQLFCGPYIDRWRRKWIMVISQFSRALIFLVPLTMLQIGHLHVWHLYIVQLVIGLIQPLYVPASQSALPALVTSEHLTKANAYLDGTVRLMSFLAPPIGGVIAASFGIQPTMLCVSLAFFASSLLLLNMREPATRPPTRKATWVQQFSKGIRYFFQQRLLLWLGIFISTVQFAVGVTMVLTVPYVVGELGGTTRDYGLFTAGFPFGYFIGSFLVGKWGEPRNRRLVMLGALVLGGSSFIALSFTHSMPAAVLIEALSGVCLPFFNAHSTTLYQRRVPREILGQILSVRLLLIRSMMPIGVFVGSHAGQAVGVRPVYFAMGSLICVVSLVGLTLPFFRFLNSTQTKT
jgi:MFS family permease